MKTVTVIMSTYNGEKYLYEQLESIFAQKNVNVKVLVRDDGSTDGTQKILDDYQNKGKLKWYTGNNLRSSKSFMDLIYSVQLDSDYYALSDQDDYWLEDKLATAINVLEKYPSNQPNLYYGKTKLVDQDLNEIKQTPITYISKTMKQAIISSGCTGCTVCFNKCLIEYLRIDKFDFDLMHDNWIHKVCMSLGGNIYFDSNPHILYRQHGNNVIGGQSKLSGRIKRHFYSATRNRCYRSNSIKSLYYAYNSFMPDNCKLACEQIVNYHKGFERFKIIFDKEYRLGDFRLDLIFVVAILFGIF